MLKIYNTMSKKIEDFIPLHGKNVGIYVCGPTVYNHIHIGNARPVVFFDMVKDYLIYLGYNVSFASNITDIDDKIINTAKNENRSEKEVSRHYAELFFNITSQLGVIKPNLTPYATDYLPEMIDTIKQLIEKGFAYVVESGIYFRVKKAIEYGKLSNQKIDELRSAVRVSLESDKENEMDFALWKFTNDDLVFDTPWKKGRPGWHIECAAMTTKLFPKGLDIHGGGFDLKFPHHENEICINNSIDAHLVAKYWMHVGLISVQNEKMSKSTGNVILVKDILKKVDGIAFRYYLLNYHYQSPFSYNEDVLEQIIKNYDKIITTLKKGAFNLSVNDRYNTDINQDIVNEFIVHMNNNFATPNVISLIDQTVKEINKNIDAGKINALQHILTVLGVSKPIMNFTNHDIDTYHQWVTAKDKKDFINADIHRKILVDKGLI